MSTENEAGRPSRQWLRAVLVALPVILFGGLAAVFFTQLVSGRDAAELPSVLIGKPAPRTVLPPLEGFAGSDGKALPGLDLGQPGDGRPVLVNVFASWCVPCRQEHPVLMDLARDGRLRLVAINYKDQPENARKFLTELGNPFEAIGVDPVGRATIDWGVYGVPESFLVAGDGTILWKQVGPFTPEAVAGGLMPAVERALLGGPQRD